MFTCTKFLDKLFLVVSLVEPRKTIRHFGNVTVSFMLENNDFVPLFKITRHHRMKCVLLKELTALMLGRVSNEEMVLVFNCLDKK